MRGQVGQLKTLRKKNSFEVVMRTQDRNINGNINGCFDFDDPFQPINTPTSFSVQVDSGVVYILTFFFFVFCSHDCSAHFYFELGRSAVGGG